MACKLEKVLKMRNVGMNCHYLCLKHLYFLYLCNDESLGETYIIDTCDGAQGYHHDECCQCGC